SWMYAPAFFGPLLMIVCRLWTFPSSSGGGVRAAAWSPAGAGDGDEAACCSCTGAAPRLPACCEPITQPSMTPNRMPQMPRKIESERMPLPTVYRLPGQGGLEPLDQRPAQIGIPGKQDRAVRGRIGQTRFARSWRIVGELA